MVKTFCFVNLKIGDSNLFRNSDFDIGTLYLKPLLPQDIDDQPQPQ